MDSLRTKYKTLRNSKKPTGDPDCPIEVKRAKRAERDIQNKMGVEDFDDDSHQSDDDEDDLSDDNDDDGIIEANEGSGGGGAAASEDDDEEVEPSYSLDFTQATSVPSSRPPTGSAKKKKKLTIAVPTAGTLRTGLTPVELKELANSLRSQSPVSASSATKRSIDTMLGELSSGSKNESSNAMAEYMMFQRMEDSKREEREYARALRERELREEREDRRREEQRLAEEREIRRDEANRQRDENNMKMMMAFISAMKNDK